MKPTIIVTGAAGGIGSGFVSEFLKTEYAGKCHGIYLYHPDARGGLDGLLAKTGKGHTYELVAIDLSVMGDVKAFIGGVNARVAKEELGRITHLRKKKN